MHLSLNIINRCLPLVLLLTTVVCFKPVVAQTPSAQTGDAQSPSAIPGGPYVASTNETISLDASGSWSFDGPIIYYFWDFGDGTYGTGPTPNHQYNSEGAYTITLTVCDDLWNCASSQSYAATGAVNVPAHITFDELPNNTNFTDQFQPYLGLYGVRFSSGNPFYPVHTYQNCGPCSTTSYPNYIATKPDDGGAVIVDFAQPVNSLIFYMIGVDAFFNQFAVIDVYRNGSVYASYPVYGNGTRTVGFTLGSLDNISKVVIRSITDPLGIGFDDFTFNVPSDIKISSGRVGGYLNGTTQNALLGGDIALQATPLPGGFAGGTYSWTCTPSTLCSIVTGGNSSSVTLRTNEVTSEVGNFTATVTYTKNNLTASGSVTIKSILPTLTSFTAQQQPNFVWAPFTCGNVGEATSLWWYRHGCHTSLSPPGIQFNAHYIVDPFISDPAKSGVKFVQAYSLYHKIMSDGVRCETSRLSESDVASGWELDTEDPYADDAVDFTIFKELTMDADDSPGRVLTHFNDSEFVDVLYVDDRAEMYFVYYSGNDPHQPQIQRPLGKYAWNWGGLVVFDPDGSSASHRERFANPVLQSPPSTFPLRPAAHHQEGPCPDGSSFSTNLNDSSRVLVKYFYWDILRRSPDTIGWNNWTSNVAQCLFDWNCRTRTECNVALGFLWSNEFRQRIAQEDPIMASGTGPEYNRRFVYWCYRTFLDRFPDQTGWDNWTNTLNANGDYAAVVFGFVFSSEYRNLPPRPN